MICCHVIISKVLVCVVYLLVSLALNISSNCWKKIAPRVMHKPYGFKHKTNCYWLLVLELHHVHGRYLKYDDVVCVCKQYSLICNRYVVQMFHKVEVMP